MRSVTRVTKNSTWNRNKVGLIKSSPLDSDRFSLYITSLIVDTGEEKMITVGSTPKMVTVGSTQGLNPFDELRTKFKFLSFLTDKEILDVISIVRSVSSGRSITTEELLQQMDRELTTNVAFC
jgi:hypothetical protein